MVEIMTFNIQLKSFQIYQYCHILSDPHRAPFSLGKRRQDQNSKEGKEWIKKGRLSCRRKGIISISIFSLSQTWWALYEKSSHVRALPLTAATACLFHPTSCLWKERADRTMCPEKTVWSDKSLNLLSSHLFHQSTPRLLFAHSFRCRRNLSQVTIEVCLFICHFSVKLERSPS